MSYNGFRPKAKRVLSDYQKRIEAIDNVILCVAEVEQMIEEIGNQLLPEPEVLELARERSRRHRRKSCHRNGVLMNF
jgi:hypothetical protein